MLVVIIAFWVGLAVLAPATQTASARPLLIAVTPTFYDNMSYVLDQFGYPYTNVSADILWDVTSLQQFTSVFVNCADNSPGYEHLQDPPADQLRTYVSEGGALYGSDWAYEFVNASWPEEAQFAGKIAPAQETIGRIVDPGLRDYVGAETVPLTYDLDSWVPITSVGPDVDVYVTNTVEYNDTTYWNVPTVIGFTYGSGYVLYTSFHEAAQDLLTLRLMEYLVLIPLTQSNWAALQSDFGSGGYATLKVNRGTVSRGGSSTFPLASGVLPVDWAGGDLRFGLRWDKGQLTFRVVRPDGTLYQETTSTRPPILIDVPNAEAGTWTYEVRGVFVPHANYPFVAAVGHRSTGGSPQGVPAGAFPTTAAVLAAMTITAVAGAWWAMRRWTLASARPPGPS